MLRPKTDTTAVPETPAGRRLREFWSLIDCGRPVTVEDVESFFAPSFLDAAPPLELIPLFEKLRPLLSSAAITGAGARGDFDVVVMFRRLDGPTLKFHVAVTPSEPHRFVKFGIGTPGDRVPKPSTWPELLGSESSMSGNSTLDVALSAKLDRLIESHRLTHRLPGLIAAVADADGRPQWFRSIGIGGVDPLSPPPTDISIRIGSISKTMTAVAVLQLVERGLVDLDKPANEYLTSYEVSGPNGEMITVRQLLTHTSGLGSLPEKDFGVHGDRVPSLSDYYGPRLVGTKVPGSCWQYSNHAFATAAQLVEDVTAQPFTSYAIEHIFDPLGMFHTSFARDDRVGTLFQGLDVEVDDLVTVPFQEVITRGAGSVYSTVDDMMLYGAAVLGRGANRYGRVLTSASMTSMFDPNIELPNIQGTMGLGWPILARGGQTIWWHNGGWPGAHSELAILPALEYTVLLFANSLVEGLDELCFSLVDTLHSSN